MMINTEIENFINNQGEKSIEDNEEIGYVKVILLRNAGIPLFISHKFYLPADDQNRDQDVKNIIVSVRPLYQGDTVICTDRMISIKEMESSNIDLYKYQVDNMIEEMRGWLHDD